MNKKTHFRIMGKANEFSTPKKKKKSPHSATFVKRSPRLMGKYKLPSSCSSTATISLFDNEVEIDMPRDETIDLPMNESLVRVENMDVVEVENEYVHH